MNDSNCPLCQKIAACHAGSFPLLVHEFAHSYLILGDHQFYPGYSVLVLKPHARELHELDPLIQKGLMAELMLAGAAIGKSYSPVKMNYASYGNQVEHVHWHIIPRYAHDPNLKDEPFSNAKEFSKYQTQVDEAQKDIRLISKTLHAIQSNPDNF